MTNPYLFKAATALPFEEFIQSLDKGLCSGAQLLHYFGSFEGLLYAFLGKQGSVEMLCGSFPESRSFPSLSPKHPVLSIFERLLYEEHRLLPEGHPWLKPVRRHFDDDGSYLKYEFLKSDSPLLHEVGVGPVHAGVIEPGHFRFICKGEIVQHLEIQLGYQMRGCEKLLTQGRLKDKIPLVESITGDTAIGHGYAHCLCVEALSAIKASCGKIRNIALEMERIAMHLADLSALAADIAYIMGQNLFAALRTTVINSSLAICGSRFGKRWLRPGGVNYGISKEQAELLKSTLSKVKEQIIDTSEAMFSNSSVLSRFDDTGAIKKEDILKLGMTGLTAKCGGVAIDARRDYPLANQGFFRPVSMESGDVFARSYLRYQEILQSFELIFGNLDSLDFAEPLFRETGEMMPNSIALSIIEGWRGRIVHIIQTDAKREALWYRVLDPSLVNWQGLALAMRGTHISDFPICNKSFDLSYCGSDL